MTLKPFIVNRLPTTRMGQKAFARWLTKELVEVLAKAVGSNSVELSIVINRHPNSVSTPVFSLLDEIIIRETAAGLGRQILLSPLVFQRYMAWESADTFKLTERFHEALREQWRITYKRSAPPFPPSLRKFRKELLAELRPVCRKLYREFQTARQKANIVDILNAFDREVAHLGCHHLGNPYNRDSWLRFLARNWKKKRQRNQNLIASFHTPATLLTEWLAEAWNLEPDTVTYYLAHQKTR